MAKDHRYYNVNLPQESEAELAAIMVARGMKGTRPGKAVATIIAEEFKRTDAKSAAKMLARSQTK